MEMGLKFAIVKGEEALSKKISELEKKHYQIKDIKMSVADGEYHFLIIFF